jgi:hypothetical protein
MHERAFRRAAVAATLTALLATSAAMADTLPTDADDVEPDVQSSIDLGPVGVGGSVTTSVWFELRCNGTVNHIEAGQTVSLAIAAASVPTGGAVTGGGTTVGPVPGDWPVDGISCDDSPVLRSATPATVSVRAPATPGLYQYRIDYERRLTPVGPDDAVDIAGVTRLTIWLDVVPNTPPTLALPSDMTIEGDTPGGASVAFTVTASDLEDQPDPTPVCSPASASFFALGTTTVECTVTDGLGAMASGAFDVTVVDTTAPTLVGLPGPTTLTTADLTGAPVAYDPPTATDLVDASPSVDCLPAPGSTFPVGTTQVTCTATDASGNAASGSFSVTLEYDRPVVLAARFDAPIGPTDVLAGIAGRNVPVKVRILSGGSPVTHGPVDLVLTPCVGGAAIDEPLAMRYQGRRWSVNLDTDGLAGCVRGTVRLDGQTAGSFDLHLADRSSARAAKPVLGAKLRLVVTVLRGRFC